MKQKVSTLLEPSLFRRVKLESAVQGKKINEIVSEALERYLLERGKSGGRGSVVARSWGALRLERNEVVRIMDEEDGLFDA